MITESPDEPAVVDDPGFYHYLPYLGRPRIQWPNDARVAVWVVPNIEFFEFLPPSNPFRSAYARPLPDVLKFSTVDFGNRVGIWRLMEVFDRFGLRATVSLNCALCDHYPEIIEECAKRQWEFFSHGIYNSRYPHGMSEEQEREMIEDAIDTVKKHTGQRIVGWLSPGMANTIRTINLISEYGFKYTCDLFHDDQPIPLNVPKGKLISMPYSCEVNDLLLAYFVIYVTPRQQTEILKAHFDRLYQEGEKSGTVMCIPLHPFAVGQPHRIKAFADALEYITRHDKVWMTTGREIADWFLAHHYEDFRNAAINLSREGDAAA